jgi:hypothetical protein
VVINVFYLPRVAVPTPATLEIKPINGIRDFCAWEPADGLPFWEPISLRIR